jgi:type I restriction enzyme S subunit
LRKNKDLQSTLPLTISAQDGLVDQTTYFNKQVASKQLRNYLLLLRGEFAYNKSYSVGYPYGAIKRLNKYDQGVLSTLYLAFKPQKVNSGFLQHYYDTDKWYREIYQNSAEGARNHGLLNISADDFFHTKLKIPGDNKEQVKIAEFFDYFDNFIDLQQKKLEQLKLLKKALLQQMLINGVNDNNPKIRFKGFNTYWHKHKLNEMLVERNIQIPESKEYPLMSFVQGKGVVPKSHRYDRNFLVKSSTKKYKKTELGDFIYSSNNLETGSIGFNKTGKAVISPVYSIFSSKNKAESYFIGFLSKQPYFINRMIRYRQGVVYGQWKIKEKDFLNITIMAPSQKEQEKLVRFWNQINKAISYNEQKVNHMQQLKKYLLQKMFI